jgi:hypothetical protein
MINAHHHQNGSIPRLVRHVRFDQKRMHPWVCPLFKGLSNGSQHVCALHACAEILVLNTVSFIFFFFQMHVVVCETIVTVVSPEYYVTHQRLPSLAKTIP